MPQHIDGNDAEAGSLDQAGVDQATETTPLLGASMRETHNSSLNASSTRSELVDPEQGGEASKAQLGAPTAALRIVLVLLVGAFTANADGSLVLATYPTIASELNGLFQASWLFVSFNLAGAATQAIYGKLSDIYGRKPLLAAAYLIFAAGCAIVGVSSSMSQVILGRVISGAGGSGLTVLAMLIITDLVPLREAAAWQSYLNLAATTGRSLGGPLGGWLADMIGWRWSFTSQVPIFLFAVVLAWFFLPTIQPNEGPDSSSTEERSLSRIDFPGAILLALTLVAFLLPFEIGGSHVPWSSPIIAVLFALAAVVSTLFLLVEGCWAKEPIFPLSLLRVRNLILGYIVSGSQCAAQLGLMFSVPLYFRVTKRASNSVAGAYLVPAVTGNAVGAILAGIAIKRTARYKLVLVVATISSALSYSLLLLRWHGNTNVLEALYIFPGGLGTGAVQTGVLIAVQAATKPAHKAAAIGGIWLTVTIGAVLGMTAVSAATTQTMTYSLGATLRSQEFDEHIVRNIIKKAASNIDYIDEADPTVSSAIVNAYIRGLFLSHIVSLVCSIIAGAAAMSLRERKI